MLRNLMKEGVGEQTKHVIILVVVAAVGQRTEQAGEERV